jgi:hypothetical protein
VLVSGATVHATVNPGNAPTTAWLRYGTSNSGTCNDTFGTKVPSAGLGVGSSTYDVAISQPLSGLAPRTTYCFCAIASSTIATAHGTVLSFKTPAK